jgi:hypothetical protein
MTPDSQWRHLIQLTNEELIMATSIRLDQSKHLTQSFDELIGKAAELCQHIDNLRSEMATQIKKFESYFQHVEELCRQGIIPLYDMENLYRFIFQCLSKCSVLLDSVCKEKRRFKSILRDYEVTLGALVEEVTHA